MNRFAVLVVSVSAALIGDSKMAHAQSPPAPEAQVEVLMLGAASTAELGLTPEVLAVSGLNSQTAESLLRAVRAEVTAHLEDMRVESAELASAQRDVRHLERSLASARSESQIETARTALESARQRLEAARLASEARRALVETAVFQSLDESTRAKIYLARENRSRGVPAKYWLMNRTDTEWSQLRQALFAISSSSRSTRPVSAEATQIVSRADGLPETAQAVAGLTRLEAIKSTWQRVVTGQGPEI